MANPAGNRAHHRPPTYLQPCVGRRVSTACLINDTDYQYLESKHQNRHNHKNKSSKRKGKTKKVYNLIPPLVLSTGVDRLQDVGKKILRGKQKKVYNFIPPLVLSTGVDRLQNVEKRK